MSHLGMSGSYRIVAASDNKPQNHDHFGFKTTSGRVYYNDPRRFGRLKLHDKKDLPELASPSHMLDGVMFYDLGPDILNEVFQEEDSTRSLSLWREQLENASPKHEIKNVLLSQSVVAGIGNIYANEILFYANIHPAKSLRDVIGWDLQHIARFSPRVLNWAIERGGTTFPGANKYRNMNGKEGDNYNTLMVYDRANKPCKACGTYIVKIVQAGRSSFFCPHCQQQ